MKELLKKISLFLRGLVGDLFELFRGHAELAVNVTGKLKAIVESPYAGVLVDLIPGEVDDKIYLKLRKVIPQVAEKTAIIFGILQANDKNSDAFHAIVNHLKTLNPDARSAFWITFAGELNIALSDGKLTLAEAVSLSQLVYAEIKRNR